jgi:DNA repair ATPase RecN
VKDSNLTQRNDIRLRDHLFKILMALVAGLVAYFLTIQDLKTAIAEKAPRQSVHQLDTRLGQLETLQKEHQVTTTEFRRFREEVIERLARIESLLERNEGK